MRITSANQSNSTNAASGTRRAGAAGSFTLESSNATGKAAATASASSIGGLDSLLALQGVEDPMARRRRFAGRGRSALDLLDELKAELLADDLRPETLGRLKATLDSLSERSGVDGLDTVLDEIGLRVAVELAKRTPKAA